MMSLCLKMSKPVFRSAHNDLKVYVSIFNEDFFYENKIICILF